MIDCNSNCGSLPCKADHTCCVPLKKADCASSCTGSLADGCGGTVACGTAAYSCFGFTPSNFDPAASGITPTTAPTVTLNCGDSTFNGTTVGNFCSQTAPLIVDQGTQVVLVFQSLTIASGAKLLLGGSKPIVIAVFGDATIDGTIDASGATTVAGPGGGGCATGTGANGGHDGSGDKGDAGGGGGGFGTAGGKGGAGDSGPGQSNGGASNGTATLVPLRGGCNGGNGGNAGSGAQGGGAGGAVQLSVAGTLSISATAHLIASGGGGAVGAASEDGGGGGGSGGAILLEGDVVNVASGAKISANGGGGASGNSSNAVDGAVGANAGEGTTQANGGGATKSAGAGGKGAAGSSAATNGGDGACDGGFLCIGSTRGAAGGGGGGGAGRIRVNATTTCTLSGSFSPAVSKSATCP
jgi:hypothetical protein